MESTQSNNVPSEDAVAELLTLTCEIIGAGNKAYYNKKGELHRIHGPALISIVGTKWWYKNDKQHREDGPALINFDGSEYYYINGIQLSKEEFQKWQKDNGIEPIK